MCFASVNLKSIFSLCVFIKTVNRSIFISYLLQSSSGIFLFLRKNPNICHIKKEEEIEEKKSQCFGTELYFTAHF